MILFFGDRLEKRKKTNYIRWKTVSERALVMVKKIGISGFSRSLNSTLLGLCLSMSFKPFRTMAKCLSMQQRIF